MDLTKFANVADLRLLAPMLIVAVVGCVLLMLQVFQRTNTKRHYLAWFATFGLGAAFLDTCYMIARDTTAYAMGQQLYIDGLSLMTNAIVLLGAGLAVLISPAYLENHRMNRGEYYALVMFSVAGMMIASASVNLFALFVGLEVMAISAYALVGFFRHSGRSAEAALKFFVLGGVSSAIFLYGIALIYGTTGTTDLLTLAKLIQSPIAGLAAGDAARAAAVASANGLLEFTGLQPGSGLPMFRLGMLPAIGMVMLIVGFGFKLALAPFHMWSPDTHQGAPSTVVAFISTTFKVATIAALIRVFCIGLFAQPARLSDTGWLGVFFWLVIISMIYGNLAAILQKNIKRLVAFAGVAHVGYLMVGVLAAAWTPNNLFTLESVFFYLAAYTLSTIGIFGVLAYFGKRGEECQTLEDFSGIAAKYPGPALAMTIFLLSSAGLPPTAGFLAKLFIFKASIQTGEPMFIGLAVVGAVTTVIAAYYHLKIVVAMYMKPARRQVRAVVGIELRAALVMCALFTVVLGVYPTPLLEQARQSTISTVNWPKEIRTELNRLKAATQTPVPTKAPSAVVEDEAPADKAKRVIPSQIRTIRPNR